MRSAIARQHRLDQDGGAQRRGAVSREAMLALGRGLAGAARGALTALRVGRSAGERPWGGGGSREAGRSWVCSDGRDRAYGGAWGGLRASTAVAGARPRGTAGSGVK